MTKQYWKHFLDHLEEYCYSTAHLSCMSNTKPLVIHLENKDGKVVYSPPSSRQELLSLLSKEEVGLILRSETETSETELRGYHASWQRGWTSTPANILFASQNTDWRSGEILPLEPGVQYCSEVEDSKLQPGEPSISEIIQNTEISQDFEDILRNTDLDDLEEDQDCPFHTRELIEFSDTSSFDERIREMITQCLDLRECLDLSEPLARSLDGLLATYLLNPTGPESPVWGTSWQEDQKLFNTQTIQASEQLVEFINPEAFKKTANTLSHLALTYIFAFIPGDCQVIQALELPKAAEIYGYPSVRVPENRVYISTEDEQGHPLMFDEELNIYLHGALVSREEQSIFIRSVVSLLDNPGSGMIRMPLPQVIYATHPDVEPEAVSLIIEKDGEEYLNFPYGQNYYFELWRYIAQDVAENMVRFLQSYDNRRS